MKRALKFLAIAALVLLLLAVVAAAAIYFTFCGGHPHGMC